MYLYVEKHGWIMPIERISSLSSFSLFATMSLETLDKKEGRWG